MVRSLTIQDLQAFDLQVSHLCSPLELIRGARVIDPRGSCPDEAIRSLIENYNPSEREEKLSCRVVDIRLLDGDQDDLAMEEVLPLIGEGWRFATPYQLLHAVNDFPWFPSIPFKLPKPVLALQEPVRKENDQHCYLGVRWDFDNYDLQERVRILEESDDPFYSYSTEDVSTEHAFLLVKDD